jgi:hypothetical protein
MLALQTRLSLFSAVGAVAIEIAVVEETDRVAAATLSVSAIAAEAVRRRIEPRFVVTAARS